MGRMMSFFSSVTTAVQNAGARIRRDAIGYAICALCAVAILILGTWAAVLALIPLVGEVYAPLAAAGAYVLVASTTLLWLQIAKSRKLPASPLAFTAGAPGNGNQRPAQFAQIAMIVEAVMLGYALSRRSDRH